MSNPTAAMATSLVKNLRADSVSQLPLREVCRVEHSTSIQDAVEKMAARRTGCALVMRDGRLSGIFTERDFLSRVVARGLDVGQSVETVMTTSLKTIHQHSSVYSAIDLMEAGGYRHMPVLGDDGQPIGVLSIKDIVHYLVEYFPANIYNLPPTPEPMQLAREGA